MGDFPQRNAQNAHGAKKTFWPWQRLHANQQKELSQRKHRLNSTNGGLRRTNPPSDILCVGATAAAAAATAATTITPPTASTTSTITTTTYYIQLLLSTCSTSTTAGASYHFENFQVISYFFLARLNSFLIRHLLGVNCCSITMSLIT